MKKIISLFLAATMMFSVLGSVTFVQASEWSAGDNVTVSVSGNVITVSGNGDMNDYSASNLPDWHDNNGDITKIVIESGVTSIGDFAFSSFMSVTGVDIANTVTRIGERAFSGCMMLKTINIPASVSEIGECAFSTNIGSLSNLSEITVDSSNKYFTVVDGILYNSAKTIMYKIPSKANITSLQVPESTIAIRKEAAAACSSLEEVNLPESVASVGAKAFADCSKLSKVVVNNRDCMLSLGSVPDNEGLQLFGYKGTNVELYKQNNGCKNIEFVPLDSESETLTATLSKTSYTYDGNEKNPTVTVKDSQGNTLVKGTDYTVTYDDDRTNVGTYNVTVTYIGEYTGTDVLSFKVIPQIPERCTPVLSKTSYTYDGNEKNPTVTIKDVVNNVLVNGTDYTLTYDADRTNVGTYNVTITYKGNYSGTDTVSFKVIEQIPERCTPNLSETTYKYDGSEKTPTVTIIDVVNNVLKEGRDYTLTYDEGRTEPGTYNVKITYKGNYSGTATLSFYIVDTSSENLTATLSKTSYTYDRNEKNPTVTVKDSSGKTLVKGTDYTVTYDAGRTNVGTYNVKVTYIGKYSGTDTLSFKVIQQIPSRCTATLSATQTYYTGTVKTPSVSIKDVVGNVLKNGTDYTVTMDSGRKNVGRYAVVINYKGNYSGSQTLYFNIIPKGITGITKITSKSKGFTVQWATQQTATTGYQVQYSTSSSFSSATTITMPKNVYYAKSVTGLTGNKKYYVRIRTYTQTKFNGSNYNIYSPWCAVKSVVTGK